MPPSSPQTYQSFMYKIQTPLFSKFPSTTFFTFSFINLGSMGSLSPIAEPLHYPVARRDESVVDNHHGVLLVPDPYRWLEKPDSEDVKDYVQKQVELTNKVLDTCDLRAKLCEKITASYDHPRYGLPFRRGRDKYFYFHNSGLQPQSVLFLQDDCLDGESQPQVLLDPNGLSDDGTISLSRLSVSQDAEYLAYGLSSSGSDWVTIKVMRIKDRRVLDDTLSWVKFSSIAWTHDGKGFFYSRYPAPMARDCLDSGTETSANLYHKLCYHFLGTDQSEDILCWKDPKNPKHRFQAEITEDGKYIVVCVEEGCDPVNKLYYLDISDQSLQALKQWTTDQLLLPLVKFIDTLDARYHLVANDETIFTFLTNKDAPRYKVVRVDLKEPHLRTDVVPEAEKDVLEFVQAVCGDRLILSYLSDVKSVLQIRDLGTGALLHYLKIDIGSVYGISARRQDSLGFVSFTSFLTPGIIYLCDLSDEVPKMKIYRESLVPGFDRSEFNAHQVFVTSNDGTRIPIFIVSKRNIKLDRSHPCLLYGYGGFDYKLSPHFKASNVVLMKHLNAVFCMANIRGGGEYGTEWHKAGSLANKQNCFNDFTAAAEYLVSAGYTQRSKLCIEGASNGGLLVAACVNQRPELFGCALAHVGVMDMLRFHKFTIGHAWTTEYGCSDKEEEFSWLIKYSPLHNVRRPWDRCPYLLPRQYPATMLFTADHDDRVVPLHSLKLLATMQHVLCTSLKQSPQTNPIIARIETKAGHGAGRSTRKMIEEAADGYGFMAKMLDAGWTD